MTAPVALYAELEATDGAADVVAAHLIAYGDVVRREPGNRRFDASRVSENPNKFFVYEEYNDVAAFRAHANTEHCASFNRAIEPITIGAGSTLTWLSLL